MGMRKKNENQFKTVIDEAELHDVDVLKRLGVLYRKIESEFVPYEDVEEAEI